MNFIEWFKILDLLEIRNDRGELASECFLRRLEEEMAKDKAKKEDRETGER